MTIDEAIAEWSSKLRKMGCVSATKFLTDRVPGFRAERLTRFTPDGEVFEHVVATNGLVHIDLAPYADQPSDLALAVEGDARLMIAQERINELEIELGVIQNIGRAMTGISQPILDELKRLGAHSHTHWEDGTFTNPTWSHAHPFEDPDHNHDDTDEKELAQDKVRGDW